MGTVTMLHYPESADAPSIARSILLATSTPAVPHDIGCALASAPAHDGASVHVSEVVCRTGMTERAGVRAETVTAAAHHIILPRGGALACSARIEMRARVVVDPAMALLVAPGQLVSIRNAAQAESAATVITVTPALLDLVGDDATSTRRISFGAIVLSPTALLDAQRVRCLANMIRELRPWHPETAAAMLASATFALLRHIVPTHDHAATASATAARRSTSRTARAVDAIRAMLAAEPGAQHTLDSISARAGISPFHLARVFHARTGFSIHQYLLHIRMAGALVALGDGETSLSRLALSLGFCSHSHFATTFRRHFGVSPRDVRAMLHESPTAPQPLNKCACID